MPAATSAALGVDAESLKPVRKPGPLGRDQVFFSFSQTSSTGLPWRLIADGNAAITEVDPPGPAFFGPGLPGHPRAGWTPSVDDKVITMRSFFDAAPDVSKKRSNSHRLGLGRG